MSIIPIYFTKNLPNAQIPTKGTWASAAYDLYAAQITADAEKNCLVVDTGLSTEFPAGYALFLYGRSGLALKQGIRLSNSVAVIDADYRGPLKMILRSDILPFGELCAAIKEGDRVAQAILMPIPSINWCQVPALSDSERGDGGFGSTGV